MNDKLTVTSQLDSDWNYESNPGFYDEALLEGSHLRPHWREIAGSLAAIEHGGLARRWREGLRLIHDNGITYNVYSDLQSTFRPWPLDPIPLVMDPDEWSHIEAAMTQRANCSMPFWPIFMGRSGFCATVCCHPN